jgi:MFS family permease
MFMLGVVPALAAFIVRRTLDEPELFVNRHCAGIGSFGLLARDGKALRATIGVAILCSVMNFGYYGLMIWMPSYLATSLGFSLTHSALWTSVTVLGMGIGIWVCGQLADRIGRKPIFIVLQAGAAILVFIYSGVRDPNMLLWVGGIMGMFVNGMMGGIGAIIAEAYPTAARATAENVLFNIGRAIGGLGPLVIGAIGSKYSFSTAIGLLSSIYVLAILTTVFLIPELKGKELE